MTATRALVSAPALAAALRDPSRSSFILPAVDLFERRKLAPMYRIEAGDAAAEAASAARVVIDVAERLRRLALAYGEWTVFEPEPYFDLAPAHAAWLVEVAERVSTVHVAFYTDLLLPSFQAALLALQQFTAGQQTGLAPAAGADKQGGLAASWQHTVSVITGTRRALSEEVSYLALNGTREEQARWRANRADAAARRAPAGAAVPDPAPTLTLSIEFPLPAARQPGRLRRLRRAWERRQWAPARP